MLFFTVGLISLLAFKAKASTIFWSNGFDYDANGLIYSGDFITPTQRGFAPVITNNNFGFSYGFNDGGGYLIADDSTNTTPFISARAWRFLDENNNLVYNFSGQSLPFDFVLWLDNQHTNNYGVKFYPSFSFFTNLSGWGGSLGNITQSFYFLDDNNNVLVFRHKITGWYLTQYLYAWTIRVSNEVDFQLSSQWGNSTSTFNYDFNAIRGGDIPASAWLTSGVLDFWFEPNKIVFEYLDGGDNLMQQTFDLPIDFTKSISKAFVKFEFSGYPLQNDLDFLRFDNLRFTSIDYVPYSKTPAPTATPTPTPTPTAPVPVPQTPNCEAPEGNFFSDFVGNVKYAMCLALNYVFVPNDNQKNYLASQLNDLRSLIEQKPVFGYFYLVKDKLNALSVNSTTSDYFVNFDFFDIATTIKQGLNYILWLVFLLYVLKRLSII